MDKKDIKEASNVLDKAEKIIIIISRPIDYDCLASGIVMYNFLKKMKKRIEIIAPVVIPEQFYQLPQVINITIQDTLKVDFSKYDLVITLDGGNTKQFAEVTKDKDFTFDGAKYILNIDHHAGNTNFAQEVLFDVKASSTAEVLLSSIIDLKILSKDETTLLYSAIVWDTGNFLHNFTTQTLKIASELIKHGADYTFVLDHILHNYHEGDFKLYAWLIDHTIYDYKQGYSYVVFDQKAVEKEFECKYPIVKHAMKLYATDYATSVSKISIAFILWQQGKKVMIKIKGNSYRNRISLIELSLALGGGGEGHFQFAPTDITGTVEDILEKIPKEIKKLRAKYNKNS